MGRMSRSAITGRRRGVVVLLTAISLTVMLGFVALAIDLGQMYLVRAELQRSADAAALAGVSAYFSDLASAVKKNGELAPGKLIKLNAMIEQRAIDFAFLNTTLRQGTHVEPGDVQMGTYDFAFPEYGLDLSGALPPNAVQVTVRRSPDGINGGVQFYFAPIFGQLFGSVTATAIAAVDDRFVGYRVEETNPARMLPFTLNEQLFDDMVANGPDEFTYDQGVSTTPDGVSEVKLFPWRWKDADGTEVFGPDGAPGSGNFGTLNVGVDSQSSAALANQIANGITAGELETEIGTSEPVFTDEYGTPQTYEITGNPGASTSIKVVLETQLGEVIGFFLHNSIAGSGSNATYTITGMRFGRVMSVDLTGSGETGGLIIQPFSYTDSNVIVREWSDATNGYVGRAVLVR